jgi:hypothetical protein
VEDAGREFMGGKNEIKQDHKKLVLHRIQVSYQYMTQVQRKKLYEQNKQTYL